MSTEEKLYPSNESKEVTREDLRIAGLITIECSNFARAVMALRDIDSREVLVIACRRVDSRYQEDGVLFGKNNIYFTAE